MILRVNHAEVELLQDGEDFFFVSDFSLRRSASADIDSILWSGARRAAVRANEQVSHARDYLLVVMPRWRGVRRHYESPADERLTFVNELDLADAERRDGRADEL